ncbi:MAG: aminopeptidase [Promethearchaeota archaeon]
MSTEFHQNLEKYAEVILNVGVNLQKGQWLLISAADLGTSLLEIAPFIEILVKKAYQMGARFVDVLWNNPQLHLNRLKYAPQDSLKEFSSWRRDAVLENIEKGGAGLSILASDPLFFNNQDPQLMTTMIQTIIKKHKPFIDLLNQQNVRNGCLISASCDSWAKRVFPNLPPDKRTAKLWDKIFEICRIKQKDPVLAWKDHFKQLIDRSNYLNQKQYTNLKLKTPGTNLIIGLPEGHIWKTARTSSQRNIDYVGNFPSEEIYTIPHKDKTEGTVTITKVLNYQGNLIEDIKMIFSKGKIKEFKATKGKDLLDKIIKTDEGASQLGEIALVPHSSPISQSGLLFYNGLIDENASCHIALGLALKPNLKNGKEMSDEEFKIAGGNISLIHVDCMIGSGEIDVDGITKEGGEEPIMRKGEWAFEV